MWCKAHPSQGCFEEGGEKLLGNDLHIRAQQKYTDNSHFFCKTKT